MSRRGVLRMALISARLVDLWVPWPLRRACHAPYCVPNEHLFAVLSDERGTRAVATTEGSEALDTSMVSRLGLTKGMVVQEFGHDGDVCDALRKAITSVTGEDLVDEDYGDVTDAAIVWFRDGDDDLADLLVDVQSLLDGSCQVVLLTPKAGREGHVVPRDVAEASSLAGLHATSTFVVDQDWTATQLVDKGRSK